MLGAAVEVAAAARDIFGPGSPACYARGRPDGQLRITEPICLTASRTDVLPHATPSEDVSSALPQYESSAGWTQGLRPRMRGRGPSLRQMSTQYTQDVVAAAAMTGFLSDICDVLLIGSPSHPSHRCPLPGG